MGRNPVQKRLIIEGLRGVVESMLGSKAFSWRLFLYAIGILIAISWLPEGTTAFLKLLWKLIPVPGSVESGTFYEALKTFCVTNKEDLLKFLASAAILLWVFVAIRRRIAHQNIEVDKRPPEQVENLVIFLSDMSEKDIATVIQFPEQIKVGKKKWEMPYLAIKYHQKLKRLFVITSSDSKEGTQITQGTTHLFLDFKKFVRNAFTDRGIDVIELTSNGVDFKDVKEVFNVIEDFYKRPDIKPKDVLVDITGGQKTNSIAGGIATLAVGRRFQYIGTNDKQVNAYDVGYFPGEHE